MRFTNSNENGHESESHAHDTFISAASFEHSNKSFPAFMSASPASIPNNPFNNASDE